MKFNCGLSQEEKLLLRHQKQMAERFWHKWFAWYPVRIGSKDCRWLETVQRHRDHPWRKWNYTALEK